MLYFRLDPCISAGMLDYLSNRCKFVQSEFIQQFELTEEQTKKVFEVLTDWCIISPSCEINHQILSLRVLSEKEINDFSRVLYARDINCLLLVRIVPLEFKDYKCGIMEGLRHLKQLSFIHSFNNAYLPSLDPNSTQKLAELFLKNPKSKHNSMPVTEEDKQHLILIESLISSYKKKNG